MNIDFGHGNDVVGTVARLRSLADDLERMTIFAPREELADAPVLENWRSCFRPSIAFVGERTGYTGTRTVLTSEIFASDTGAGWVRTFNRFYKLGRPAIQETAS
jgi:hypothetical protein